MKKLLRGARQQLENTGWCGLLAPRPSPWQIYWILLGSSGHRTRPTGRVVESYTACTPAGHKFNTQVRGTRADHARANLPQAQQPGRAPRQGTCLGRTGHCPGSRVAGARVRGSVALAATAEALPLRCSSRPLPTRAGGPPCTPRTARSSTRRPTCCPAWRRAPSRRTWWVRGWAAHAAGRHTAGLMRATALHAVGEEGLRGTCGHSGHLERSGRAARGCRQQDALRSCVRKHVGGLRRGVGRRVARCHLSVQVDENRRRIARGRNKNSTHVRAAVYHYVIKSGEDYAEKMARGGGAGVTRPKYYFSLMDRCAIPFAGWRDWACRPEDGLLRCGAAPAPELPWQRVAAWAR
jgi:hypothetical protein